MSIFKADTRQNQDPALLMQNMAGGIAAAKGFLQMAVQNAQADSAVFQKQQAAAIAQLGANRSRRDTLFENDRRFMERRVDAKNNLALSLRDDARADRDQADRFLTSEQRRNLAKSEEGRRRIADIDKAKAQSDLDAFYGRKSEEGIESPDSLINPSKPGASTYPTSPDDPISGPSVVPVETDGSPSPFINEEEAAMQGAPTFGEDKINIPGAAAASAQSIATPSFGYTDDSLGIGDTTQPPLDVASAGMDFTDKKAANPADQLYNDVSKAITSGDSDKVKKMILAANREPNKDLRKAKLDIINVASKIKPAERKELGGDEWGKLSADYMSNPTPAKYFDLITKVEDTDISAANKSKIIDSLTDPSGDRKKSTNPEIKIGVITDEIKDLEELKDTANEEQIKVLDAQIEKRYEKLEGMSDQEKEVADKQLGTNTPAPRPDPEDSKFDFEEPDPFGADGNTGGDDKIVVKKPSNELKDINSELSNLNEGSAEYKKAMSDKTQLLRSGVGLADAMTKITGEKVGRIINDAIGNIVASESGEEYFPNAARIRSKQLFSKMSENDKKFISEHLSKYGISLDESLIAKAILSKAKEIRYENDSGKREAAAQRAKNKQTILKDIL